MDFRFGHEVLVEGVIVSTYEGKAVIEADALGTWPGQPIPEWTVGEIVLDGVKLGADGRSVEQIEVDVPDEHPLHDVLLLVLLGKYREDIDEAWAEYMHGAIDKARSRFFIPPRMYPANSQELRASAPPSTPSGT